MGGCTQSMPAKDMAGRQGNITPTAEFNFYMAAKDARTVLESGIPIVLFPMNCTHQMTFTDEREEMVRKALGEQRSAAENIIGMIKAPADIDEHKFGIAPVMHDINTALYLLFPELYEGRRGHVNVTVDGPDNGKTDFCPDENGQIYVMEQIRDPEKLFSHVVESFQKCLVHQSQPQLSKPLTYE